MNDTDVLVVEFREPIRRAIPEIISLLRSSELNVCIAGAYALSKLSERCKVSKSLT